MEQCEPRVAELVYYPVKGFAGVSVQECALTAAGLQHDRAFMVVDEAGIYQTQRRFPRMAVIRPEISSDGRQLSLHAPDVGDVEIEVDDISRARTNVDLFGKPYSGIDQGDAVAEWLSETLGAKIRLVRVPPEHDRVTDGRTPGTAAYADGGAVLITSSSSLDSLHERIGEAWLPMNRFRPNIVITGSDEAFAEDRMRRLTIGDAELAYAKLAIRCVVTTVSQERGEKAGPEPLKTLATYRHAAEGGVAFGSKFSVTAPGKLSVGDEVIVGEWGETEV